MSLPPVDIAALEERRQAALLADVAPLVRPFAGGVMGFHEPGSWQNQACGIGLAGPVSDADLDAFVDFYTSRGVEPRAELSPFADETLIAGLAARGFVIREFENVLARDLPAGEDLDAALPHPTPAGLELTPLDRTDPDALTRIAEVSLRGFYPDTDIPPPMLEASRQTLALPATLTYAATLDGQLAAAGSVHLGDRAAALMGVSTLPPFRRRGIQQALIARRLAAARDHGCILATISSKPGIPTERNALRLGFTMAYTKVIVVRPGPGLAASV
jgi:GNAT superfamily N-acetyltransferase